MTSLADDLLRNRPISDLRVLIKQLHDDGEEKKRELRRMVGSQYHEFIQSADNLAGMHAQSQQMLYVLDKFWKQRDSFVKEVHGFLDGKTNSHSMLGATDNARIVRTVDLVRFADSSSLWRELGQCDIYSASLRVLAALVGGKDSQLLNASYIHPNTLEGLKSMQLTPVQQSSLRSVSFLGETVLDDAMLLAQDRDRLAAQESSLSLLTAAKTYAVMITLRTMIGGSNLDTHFDPLDTYFQHASSYLNLMMENELSASGGDIESGMLHLVAVLQSIVLEAYTLFVHSFPHPFATQGSDKKTSVQGLVGVLVLHLQGDVNQLFASEQHLLGASIYTPDTSALTKIKKWVKEQLRIVTDRCSATLSALGNAAQIAQLQQSTYLACIHPHFLAVTAEVGKQCVRDVSLSTLWCDASVAVMLPAQGNKGKRASQDVAELSLLLWTRVFRVSFLHQVERLLQQACEDIFANVQQQVVVAFRHLGLNVGYELNKKGGLSIIIHATDNATTTPLTSSQLFMIAERIRFYLDRQLAQLRDDVVAPVQRGEESMTGDRRRTNSGGGNANSGAAAAVGLSGQALKEALQGNCSKLLGQVLSLLRRMLEACQDILYEHRAYPLPPDTTLAILAADSNGIVDEEEKRLWLAVQKQFLHGQQTKNSKITLTRPDELHPSSSTSGHSQSHGHGKAKAKPTMQNALQGVLFIGRLVWVLRGRADTCFTALRDDFTSMSSASLATPSTDEAITTTAAAGGSMLSHADSFSGGGSAAVGASGRVSEEQCRSAFEISDTNGDGVVDHAEALDALRALCLHEREEEILSAFTVFTQEKHIPTLQRSLSALHTLTFEEFILIAGPLLLMGANDQRSLSRLFTALDHLIAASHLSYITAVACQGSLNLAKVLVDDLGGFGKEMVKCRALWIAKDIDSAASEDKEKLWLPGRCSVALQQFFFQFNAELSAALLSLDTLQALPVDVSSQRQLKNEDVMYLGHFMKPRAVDGDSSALAMLCHRWSSAIVLPFLKRVYANTITALSAAQPIGVTINKRVFQQRLDDAHMQLLLDLMVLDDLFTVPDVNSKGASAAGRRFATMKDGPFQDLIDKCRIMLDPIMLELGDIVLREAVKRIKEETKLILGPVSTAGAPSATNGGMDTNTVGAASVSVDHGLLERLFSTAFEHNAVPKASAAPRLALLPLALPGTAGVRNKGAETEAPTPSTGAGKGNKVAGAVGIKSKGGSTSAATAAAVTKWW